jgi:hypothetical protein
VAKQWSDCLDHGNAIHRLQLQQLDRHRDRLLFGYDQSRFNHNEWANYGDSHLYAEQHANAYSNGDGATKSDCNANRNGDTYSDRNTDVYANSNANSDRYPNTTTYSNRNGDADPDCNADRYAYTYSNGDREWNANTYSYANSKRSSDCSNNSCRCHVHG